MAPNGFTLRETSATPVVAYTTGMAVPYRGWREKYKELEIVVAAQKKQIAEQRTEIFRLRNEIQRRQRK